jgi:hypothetical protein
VLIEEDLTQSREGAEKKTTACVLYSLRPCDFA